ncbi:MAG: carboxypeptidase-like regulatory domain-containing protein [Candidatus Hydrogenedentes bacterium]|nr:carboxypeptidase-like regulatory domain-containing protein [Candidatus Hydrogenedentota bacterium]
MSVSITGNVTDSSTGASIPDVSVSLAVEDNGFTARKHAEVSTSNDSGRIVHDEFVGWCQRVGPLGHVRFNRNTGTIEITLTHPKYHASSYSYTFDEVWYQ